MEKTYLEYYDDKTLLEAYVAYQKRSHEKRPAVIIVHDWSGRNEFANTKAEQLAELGYVGFALDMYGKGKLGKTNEEKSALMQPLVNDRTLLRQRILAAFQTVTQLEQVDAERIAVIGFCFGGLCALDLARSGANLRGAISLHGFLHAPADLKNGIIKAKILVLHGYLDPMAPPDQLAPFAEEMNKAQVDWQMHYFGNALHAFTNPLANNSELGLVYNPHADARSWLLTKQFLEEVFI